MKITRDDESVPALHGDEEYGLPCAEALLAGALALMTGHAQACCDNHREGMARKIVHNLFLVSQHPTLSPDFKTVVWNLHHRWVQQVHARSHLGAQVADATAVDPAETVSFTLDHGAQRALWHATPEVTQ